MHLDSLYDSGARAKADGRPRIRERLARDGPAVLSDIELLAALLGTGIRGKSVLELADDALALIDSGRGVPEAKACAICAALELGRRLFGVRDRKVASPRDIWPLVSHWSDRKQERFICCSLNGAHELIAARIVSVGLVNRTVVHTCLSSAFLKYINYLY